MILQLESLRDASYSNILRLAELCFTFAKPETCFSHMKRMETNNRSRLSERNRSTIMRIGMDGEEYLKYDSVTAVDTFLKSKYRRLGSNNENRKRPSDNDVSGSGKTTKKAKLHNAVLKKLHELLK